MFGQISVSAGVDEEGEVAPIRKGGEGVGGHQPPPALG